MYPIASTASSTLCIQYNIIFPDALLYTKKNNYISKIYLICIKLI